MMVIWSGSDGIPGRMKVPGGEAIAYEQQLAVFFRNGIPVMEAYMPRSVDGDCDAHVRAWFFAGAKATCDRAFA